MIAVYPTRPYDPGVAVVCPVCRTRDEWPYFWGWRGELGPECSGGCGAFMVRETVALVLVGGTP